MLAKFHGNSIDKLSRKIKTGIWDLGIRIIEACRVLKLTYMYIRNLKLLKITVKIITNKKGKTYTI